MNFLALCQETRSEGGIAGDGPSAVSGQTGMNARIVSWVKRAWLHIQSEHADSWLFLRTTQNQYDLTADVQEVTATAMSLSDVGNWDVTSFRIYDTAIGLSDESFLRFISYDKFEPMYLYGDPDSNRPTEFSINPQGNIVFNVKPDKSTYRLHYRYYRTPVSLVADTDVPAAPAQYHYAIVFKALEFFGKYEESPEVIQLARDEYDTWMTKLEINQLPDVKFGEEPIGG